MSPQTPPNPTPDTKDWTWTLLLPCPDCGLSAGDVPGPQVPARLAALAADFSGLLRSGAPGLTARPAPQVWSPTEYGAHVRDVFKRFAQRLRLMLTDENPDFEDWDQDATAVAERYHLLEPAAVAAGLDATAAVFLAAVEGVGVGDWDRTGRRSNGSTFTVATLLQYLLHDVAHHWWDVTGTRAD